jgi:hypothetical protein
VGLPRRGQERIVGGGEARGVNGMFAGLRKGFVCAVVGGIVGTSEIGGILDGFVVEEIPLEMDMQLHDTLPAANTLRIPPSAQERLLPREMSAG